MGQPDAYLSFSMMWFKKSGDPPKSDGNGKEVSDEYKRKVSRIDRRVQGRGGSNGT